MKGGEQGTSLTLTLLIYVFIEHADKSEKKRNRERKKTRKYATNKQSSTRKRATENTSKRLNICTEQQEKLQESTRKETKLYKRLSSGREAVELYLSNNLFSMDPVNLVLD